MDKNEESLRQKNTLGESQRNVADKCLTLRDFSSSEVDHRYGQASLTITHPESFCSMDNNERCIPLMAETSHKEQKCSCYNTSAVHHTKYKQLSLKWSQ